MSMHCTRRGIIWLTVWLSLSGFMVTTASSPLIFTREVVTITPRQEIQRDPENPPIPRLNTEYLVEVRDERALYLEEMHSLTQLTEQTGVVIAFSAPTMIALPKMSIRQKLDVLFVDEEGLILQMLPDHIPAESNARLVAEQPVKAWVYLKAGQITARDIRPQDHIKGSMFTPPPPIIK